MNKPLSFDPAALRPGHRIKHDVSDTEFEVSVIQDWYTEPLGFIAENKYSGTKEFEAPAVTAVLWDDTVGAPFSRWTGGNETSWVPVIARPSNWDDMGSSEKDLWEERALRGTAGVAR